MLPLALRATKPVVRMPDEVLTIKEVAAPLKLAEKAVYAVAQAGEIPAFKIWRQCCIRRPELGQCIDAQPRGRDGGRGE